MALRRWQTVSVISLALLATIALAASAPSARAGTADPCKQWGDVRPDELSNGQARAAVLCLVNRKRDQAGLGSLNRDRRLQKAAQRHNERMRGTGCFSHQCSGEAALDGRLRSVGYLGGSMRRWAYGENIAWGLGQRGTPAAAVDAWMNSPPHRAGILSGSFRELGIGFNPGSPSRKKDPGGIYTIDFGLVVG